MEDDSTFIGAAEASRILGLHRSTVNELAKKGEIPTAAELPGRTGARFFRREDVEAYRNRRRAS